MAPWVHMSIWQTGDAYPCCMYDWQTPIANINNTGIKGAWNSIEMKKLRLQMMRNEQSSGCQRCFDYDKQGILSYRHKMNTEFKHHYNLVDTTTVDGTVDKINLSYFDIRFSNLCNMKCRSCGPHFSSKWAEDTEGRPIKTEIEYTELWTEIEEVLPNVEEIYFTGGESLFMPQHYKLLDLLIEKKLKPKLTYNSNASRLSLKNQHVKDYWKHFDNIFFCVSFDQIKETANYTRHGQNWNKVYDSLCWIRDEMPQIYIQPNPTISILNILDIEEIITFLFDNNIATDCDINLNNLLVSPDWLSCTILPPHLKSLAENRIYNLINKLDNWTMDKERREFHANSLINIVKFMNNQDSTHLIPNFKKEMLKIDKIRNEDFTKVFPEMSVLYD